MATIALVKEAILALNDRTGSSVIAINKYIEGEKKTLVKKHVMRAALKRGVEDGTLMMVKNSYKLSPETKKKAAVLKPVNANNVVKKKKTTTTKAGAPKKTKAVQKTTTAKKTSSTKTTTSKTKTVKKLPAKTNVKKTTEAKEESAVAAQ